MTAFRSSKTWRWPVLASVMLVVAACGTAPESPPVSAQPELPPSSEISTIPPAPASARPEPEIAEDGEAAEPEETEEKEDRTPRIALPEPDVPQLAAVPPAADLPGPEGLIGLNRDELLNLLGEPGFKRTDPPAELWQYGGNGCYLDVFLYGQKKGGGVYRVTHVEARGRTVASVPLEKCYFSLFVEAPKRTGN